MESWDGPAAICGCHDQWAIAGMDRNGLRPLRDTITKDYLVAYKGQNTIHTLETTVRIEPNEFNRSINSTAKTFISGSPTTGGNEGSDINESEQLKPKLSGSGWSPYITAIQLYSGHKNTVGASTRQVPLTEPVLVAHLPRPVQAPTDQALTFKVRIDL